MTGKIAPHKEQYAELLLAGEKPVAILEAFDKGFGDVLDAVEQGTIKSITTNVGGSIRLYFCIPGKEDDMHELAQIYEQLDYEFFVLNKIPVLTDHQNRRIGQILGYSAEDIEAYLQKRKPTDIILEP